MYIPRGSPIKNMAVSGPSCRGVGSKVRKILRGRVQSQVLQKVPGFLPAGDEKLDAHSLRPNRTLWDRGKLDSTSGMGCNKTLKPQVLKEQRVELFSPCLVVHWHYIAFYMSQRGTPPKRVASFWFRFNTVQKEYPQKNHTQTQLCHGQRLYLDSRMP